MNIVKIEETFVSPIEDIWDLLTNLDHQGWRSQLDRIEKLDNHRFIEYDNEGYQTEFIILNKIKYETYEFNMKNNNIEGHWIGKLKTLPNGRVHLEMTEAIQVKKKIMQLFANKYLKKQQKQFIIDLKKALKEE